MDEITQQDLEQLSFIHDQIKNFLRSKEISSSRNLSDDLESTITNAMSEISSKICEDIPPESLQLFIITSRYTLFKFCADQLSLAQEDESCSIWTQIFFQVEKVFQQLANIGFNLCENLDALRTEMKTTKKETDLVLQAAEELEKTTMVRGN